MAHRKPLGTTCRTLADWPGEKPLLGDYVQTAAGTAYLIVGVEEKANPAKIGLVLERVATPDPESVTWPFEWYPRDRRRH